jgi:WD40 repeat protein/serine/threonine protein kinase
LEELRPDAAALTGGYVAPPDQAGPPERVGDFRILREVGRGGMGIVYEAEQESLGRRVALKILPAGALLDERLRQRFQREARAAARLHHTNIVPVFGVGEDGGLLYYVMQFIPGLGLDRVLTELRRLGQKGSPAAPVPATVEQAPAVAGEFSAADVAFSLLSGPAATGPFLANPAGSSEDGPARLESNSKPLVARPDSASVLSLSGSGRHYWKAVARIGAQVAEALDYAAGQGILHRDVKPSNLLLDLQGNVWVTDFGLAKATSDGENLTHTGDIVGTLRYMAPERFQGRSDIRAEVYSLGLTLYELLVQRPAFTETDRSKLIHQLTHEEPVPPRRLEPAIPRDLETVVLKAIARDPMHRYQRAGELAEDLRRFGEDRPVKARRVSGAERLWRWCKRNPALATLTAAVVLVLLAGTAISTFFGIQAARQAAEALAEKGRADEKADEALAEKQRANAEAVRAKEKAAEALEAMNKAQLAHAVGLLRQTQIAWRDNSAQEADALLQEVPANLRGWEWNYLKRLCRGGYMTLYGHSGAVLCVAYSPDGKRLATGSGDWTTRTWDAQTGRELLVLKGHAGSVYGLAFSADGRRLATASADRTARIWDARTGQELLTVKGHKGGLTSVAFSPDRDGQRLATASLDGTVQVWDAHTGQPVLALQGHDVVVRSVAFSPDGKLLASGGGDSTVRLWDFHTGQLGHILKGHTGAVLSVAFSPDGQHLASAANDNTPHIWEVRTGREVNKLQGRFTAFLTAAFSPDGQRLAVGSWDQTVRIWDARSGRETLPLKGHTGFVWGVAFSPDGQRVATASADGTTRVWDVRREGEALILRGFPQGVGDVAFSPDGQRLATAAGIERGAWGIPKITTEVTTGVWDAQTGEEILALKGKTGSAVSVAFSPDGRRLATGSEDGTTKLWDARSGQELLRLNGHTDRVRTVVFSPDGRRLATASWDGTTKVWDVDTGRRLLSLAGRANRAAFSPDGLRLATANYRLGGGTATIWDALSGQKLLTLKELGGWGFGVAFSPDGRRLATTSEDGAARIWDVVSGQLLLTCKGHHNYADGVTFSPDGQRLVTTGFDGTVKIWDARTGQGLATLTGHTELVSCVAFRPDGRRIATGSLDRTVRIWDGRPVQESLALEGHRGSVRDVAFSPNGRHLATGSADKTIRVWDAVTGREMLPPKEYPCNVLAVAFSPDGELLAGAGYDQEGQSGIVKVWNERTGREVHTFTGNRFTRVAFSPDGELLAGAGFVEEDKSGIVKVWNERTGREVHTYKIEGTYPSRMVFSPDGQRLATSNWDGTTKVWDLKTGQETADTDAKKLLLLAPDPARSRDGRFLARADGEVVYIDDLKQPPDVDELAYRQAMGRLDPIWQEEQAARCERDRQWFAAAFHLDQALAARPDSPLHGRRGQPRAELGRWEEARADFARAVEEGPDQPDAWRCLALTQLLLKQTEEHRQTCARFLEHFRFPPEAAVVGLVFGTAAPDPFAGVLLARLADPLLPPLLTARRSAARTALLRGNAVAEPSRLLFWAGDDPVVRGAVLCRAGRYDEAVQALGDDHDITALLYRALAEHGRGREVAARTALQESEQLLAKSSTDDVQQTNAARLPWDRRAEAELLRAEVRALLPGQGP